MNESKTLAPLWDLDILRYRCGFAADAQIKKEAKEAEPGASDERIMEMLHEVDYLPIALQNVKTVLEAGNERFDASRARYFIQGQGNFRFELATILPYKGNRDKAHKPKYYKEIKDYLIDHWNAEPVDDIETDDMLGIVQCSSPNTVIISTDKDLQMIPGWNYNWVKDELVKISQEEADLMLFWQMLVGDTSDNIPGIPGIGKVRAQKIVEDNGNDLGRVREAVKQLYKKEYGETWAMAYEEVANLLWMQREPNQRCPLL